MQREKIYLSTIDPEAQLLAQRHGFGLEIAEYCTAWNLDRDFEKIDPLVRKKMSYVNRFTLHGPYNELFPCAIDPKARELAAFRFRQTLELADRYGIRKVVLHGGFQPMSYYPCWYQEQSGIFWREFAPEIPKGMTVCLENVLEPEPEMLAEIVRSAECSQIRMCLDVGHVNAYSAISVFDWLEHCGDVISHFHIHNNDASRDTHSGLNTGTIPMKKLLLAIEKRCPEATLTLELPEAAKSVEWLEQQNILEEEK